MAYNNNRLQVIHRLEQKQKRSDLVFRIVGFPEGHGLSRLEYSVETLDWETAAFCREIISMLE